MTANQKFPDLLGLRFGRLIVISHQGISRGHHTWECKCDCGGVCVVASGNLRSGNTRSCGCLSSETTSERNRTHGMSDSKEYKTWRSMLDRCSKPSQVSFERYGGRGITVCERWKNSFEHFLSDMGMMPSPEYTIERNDSNGNYEPTNCRWATKIEQANNKRNTVWVDVAGVKRSAAEWSRLTGISGCSIRRRIQKGWKPLDAISLPTRKPNEIRL